MVHTFDMHSLFFTSLYHIYLNKWPFSSLTTVIDQYYRCMECELHVSYMLLMQDSIGGSCHSLMITNVAPEERYYYDTYCTLNFATKSKKIVNNTAIKETVTIGTGYYSWQVTVSHEGLVRVFTLCLKFRSNPLLWHTTDVKMASEVHILSCLKLSILYCTAFSSLSLTLQVKTVVDFIWQLKMIYINWDSISKNWN